LQAIGDITCHLDRFSTAFPNDPNFQELGFLKNITNMTITARKSVGVGEGIQIIIRVFKETDFGEVHLDTIINQTIITTSDQRIFMPISDINSNFKSNENLEMELCGKRIGGAGSIDLIYSFNSTGLFDGGFKVNSINTNQTLDFTVGGASELNVRNDNLETAILVNSFEKLSNHNLCISNTTLQHNISIRVGSGNSQQIIEEEECPFGCDQENNRCNPSPFDQLIWYVIPLIVFVIIMVIIIAKVARR
jgi:hypothetical protein